MRASCRWPARPCFKTIFAFTLALPVEDSFFFAWPLTLIATLIVFGPTALRWILTMPLPETVTLPAAETLTGSFAVPVRLFSLTLPILSVGIDTSLTAAFTSNLATWEVEPPWAAVAAIVAS